MIELKDVSKYYGSNKNFTVALNRVNLKIEDKRLNVIIGKSGCGKSTLMNLIGAIDKPSFGTVIIDGIDLSTLSDKELSKYRNEHIGFVFQQFYLEPSFTVLQNVCIPLMARGVIKGIREFEAHKYLKMFGIDEKANNKANELSGGEAQRVAIARALVGDPDIILADEPTGNLDSENGKAVLKILRYIVDNGKTVVLVTHNPEDAKMGDVIIRLKDGEVVKIEEN